MLDHVRMCWRRVVRCIGRHRHASGPLTHAVGENDLGRTHTVMRRRGVWGWNSSFTSLIFETCM